MKVLSIQEPYASLISNGIKSIETRSWKTNYRGEILIHASLSKKFLSTIKDPIVLDIINSVDMKYGKILCSAKLIDCVLMDEEFIKNIKTNIVEYKLGIYEIGRYAWLLKDIKILKNQVEAKGKLNLWDYNYSEDKIENI